MRAKMWHALIKIKSFYYIHSGAALGIQIDGAKIFVQNEISKIGTKPYWLEQNIPKIDGAIAPL